MDGVVEFPWQGGLPGKDTASGVIPSTAASTGLEGDTAAAGAAGKGAGSASAAGTGASVSSAAAGEHDVCLILKHLPRNGVMNEAFREALARH